jgi:effector-binding domain-containing protein
MRIFKVLGTGLILLIMLWLVISIFLPSTVRIERAEIVNARMGITFDQINEPGTWKYWMNPARTKGFPDIELEGPKKGPGSVIKWESAYDSVGTGMIAITAVEEPRKILLKVDLDGCPEIDGGLQLDSTDNKNITYTTLYMNFHVGFFGRVFPGLMLDGWAGPLFEKVLIQLSGHCEQIIPKFNPKYNYEDMFTTETYNLTVRRNCEPKDISVVLGECYDILIKETERQKLQVTGPPFSIYHHFDDDSVSLEAGIPVDRPGRNSGKVNALTIPSERAVRVDYYGAYNNINDAYRFMRGLTARKIFTENGPPRESYVTDPGVEPDTSKWHTQIYFPVE